MAHIGRTTLLSEVSGELQEGPYIPLSNCYGVGSLATNSSNAGVWNKPCKSAEGDDADATSETAVVEGTPGVVEG